MIVSVVAARVVVAVRVTRSRSSDATNAPYTGSVLGEIDLSGKFMMTGDYVGNNEGTKFDLYLTGLQQVLTSVPEPGSLALVALSVLDLAATRRRKAA